MCAIAYGLFLGLFNPDKNMNKAEANWLIRHIVLHITVGWDGSSMAVTSLQPVGTCDFYERKPIVFLTTFRKFILTSYKRILLRDQGAGQKTKSQIKLTLKLALLGDKNLTSSGWRKASLRAASLACVILINNWWLMIS